jgi:hypothetical protein
MGKMTTTETQVDHILERLSKDPALDFATNKWAPELLRLSRKSSKNGFATQMLGIARLAFTVPLPLFAGLGLTGNGATAVRWVTFGLSVSAALIAAYVGIRGYEPRWRLYHTYASQLLSEGWLYLERAGTYAAGGAPNQAALFVQRVCEVLETMNKEYATIVHASVSTGGGSAA